MYEGKPCRAVATQCIEAGVDLDFKTVYRALAPLDAIIQAAGRCNRNGRDRMGRAIVFCPEDSRRLYPDDCYNNAAVTVQEMSPPFSIHDPDNIREYYQRLFDGSTDKKALTEGIDARSFAQTAAQYKLIDNAGVQIIVPYAEKRELYKSISKQLREQGADARILKEAASITLTCFGKMWISMRKKFRLPAEAELGSMGRRREAACTCSVRNMKNTILRRWDFIYRREKNLTVYGKDSTLSLRFIGHSTCYYFTDKIDGEPEKYR